MKRDRYKLLQQWQRLVRSEAKEAPHDQRLKPRSDALEPTRSLTRFMEELRRSIEVCEARKANLPTPILDSSLPIFEKADEIRQAILEHQVLVLSGETGSGKSTQLPLICLQAGYGVTGFIGHTQPRRIAARGVASRIAFLLASRIGEQIGCKIRFSDQTGDQTYVKLMTDGILLAETQTDRFLDQYEVLIVDEAHERSLNIDFLLGYLRGLLPRRPDLRLIITSATIDTQRFADHFTIDPARPVPVLHVEGRTYPVEIRYRSCAESTEGSKTEGGGPFDGIDVEDAIVQAVQDLSQLGRGDILVFLPTEHDIRVIAKKLRARPLGGDGIARTEILPLYARLSNEQQGLVFQPGKHRRIVLATNVAESSITVPGIRYVVDTGSARISRYAPRSKVQRLPIEAISQASAKQRAGRCGRVGPGICIRLYSEQDFLSRPEFTTPEIRRTNLASTILQTQALKLGPIEEFPFIDPPQPDAVRDGYKTLFEIGAVDAARRLTPLGRKLTKLPTDPRVGRMLFAANENGCLAEVLIITAALEGQDPRLRPVEQQQAADESHRRFSHEDSDFLAWLKLWEFLHHLRSSLSRSRFRKACQESFLSLNHFQQWSDIHRQLREIATSTGMKYTSRDFRRQENYQAIHTSIAAGLLSGVAMQTDKSDYTGAGGVKFGLWPGSGLFKTRPKWVLVAEIVETAKRYGRHVAKIEPECIEPIAQHVVKRSYLDPHWSRRRETAMAYENVSLFGLPIVMRRRIQYSSIDRELSRKLFIEQGLVQGELRRLPEFLQSNQAIQVEAAKCVAKTRERHLIVDEATIEAFYDSRLPEAVCDLHSLEQQLRDDSKLSARLTMTIEDLVGSAIDTEKRQQFPDQVQVGSIELPVHYRFAPGDIDDGATLEIPLEAVAQLDNHQLGWLIPGLIPDHIEALIRSLPKSIRRTLIPAPETAQTVVNRLNFGHGPFLSAVASELSKLAGMPVRSSMFDPSKVADNLKLNLRLVDEAGVTMAESRSLDNLIRAVPGEHRIQEVDAGDDVWKQDRLTAWNWGDLPNTISIRRGVAEVPVYPAVVDQSNAVGLRLFDSQQRADVESQRGIARLFYLENRKLVRSQINWLPEIDQLSITACLLFPGIEEFKSTLADLLVRLAFVENRPIPRSRLEFEKLCEKRAELISVATQDLAGWLPKLLHEYQEVRLQLEKQSGRQTMALKDIKQQLEQLFPADFVPTTPWRWLRHYPRYLNAIRVRLERLTTGHTDRDQEHSLALKQLWSKYEQAAKPLAELGRYSENLEHARWLIEEYRVSLYAQQLGTSEKVSAQRIEKRMADLI